MTRPSGRRSAALASATAFAVFAAGGAAYAGTAAPATATTASGTPSSNTAAGAPGAPSYFDLARKDCLGTARNTTSRVWYTVAGGVLSDVYEPTIDNTNISTLQYVVTDGSSFTDLQTRDMSYTVQPDETGMVCTVTSTNATHGYQLTTTYLTDPQRDSVLMNTRLAPIAGSSTNVSRLHVFARVDAHVNGNGGGGTDNAGADTGVVDASSGVPVVYDTATESQAANRTYAVPTFMALAAELARRGFELATRALRATA